MTEKLQGGITGKGFVKGDPRINRNGRPKKFDQWRSLLLELGEEPATKGTELIKIKIPKTDRAGRPVVDENGNTVFIDHYATNAEMIARAWMRDPKNQKEFIENAFGKPPDQNLVDELEKERDKGGYFSIPAELLAPDFLAPHRALLSGKYSELCLYGGRGSTKSTFTAEEIIAGLENDPLSHALCMRYVADTLRISVFDTFIFAIDNLGLSDKYKTTSSPLEITRIATGQKIYFRGADDPLKLKSFRPPFGYVKFLWFEELPEFHGETSIRSITQSAIRGTDKAIIFKTWNPPPTTGNWVNKIALLPKEGRLLHKSDYRNVPPEWLGKMFIDEAEFLKEVNPKAYAHEYLGEVNGLGDMVFENLEIREITDKEIAQFDNVCDGLDFGYYPHPAHYSKTHYNATKHELYIFGECRRWKASSREMYDAICESGYNYYDLLIADSEDPKTIADYRDFGANIRGAEKGPGSVKYSMKWLQSLAKIIIDQKRCPYTVEEFTDYAYERTKDGEIIEAYPREKDDAIAAVRYSQNLQWRQPGR
jgi:PBSX family phage terminase large subunit